MKEGHELDMKAYNMKEYWNKRAEFFEEDEFKAICVFNANKELNRIYNALQRQLLSRLLKKSGKGKTVLEIGCGIGRWAAYLQEDPAVCYTGIDISPKMVEIAKRRIPSAAFFTMSADALTFSDEQFDLVVSVTVLHHIPLTQQYKAVAEMCRVTKKGGYIILIEDTRAPETLFNLFVHKRHEWKQLFEDNGCKLRYIINHKCDITFSLVRYGNSLMRKAGLRKTPWVDVIVFLENLWCLLLPESYFSGVGIVFKKEKK